MKNIYKEYNMKKTLFAIGESLIDFIPSKAGCNFDDVDAFYPKVGGAPANVLGAFSKLGGSTQMLTQLGDDPFGHKILNAFKNWNIGTDYIPLTDKANTALAFVSLLSDGNREFSFYRNPSADMLYSEECIKKEWFKNAYGLHFCSVSLGDTPMKKTHIKAIDYTLENDGLVSFDLNLRFPLWKDKKELKETVHEFMPLAHVVKLSDEELEFVCDTDDILKAKDMLLNGNTKLILYTCGKDGAYALTKNDFVFSPSKKVDAIDTTGAGDAFCGSFLYSLYSHDISADGLDKLNESTLKTFLSLSNKYCGKSVQKWGAIESYPDTL
jgi:fructokinase